MNVRPSKKLIEHWECAIKQLHGKPIIKFKNEVPNLERFKSCIHTRLGNVYRDRVILFFNESEAKLVIELNVDNLFSNDTMIRKELCREIILNETKQTHTKDSRQRLQGAGLFRLLGNYASHIRQLLRK